MLGTPGTEQDCVYCFTHLSQMWSATKQDITCMWSLVPASHLKVIWPHMVIHHVFRLD